MVCLLAQQAESVQEDCSPGSAARALLDALRAPIRLEWKAELGSGMLAVLSTEISQDVTSWPPSKATLRISPHRDGGGDVGDVELKIPSAANPAQLEAILQAGMAFLHQSPGNGGYKAAPAESLSDCPEAYLCSATCKEGIEKVQARCLQQWHHDVCGHHALFSTSCLVRGESSALLHEETFWHRTLHNIMTLADHGEASGRWPRSRVTGGVADACHLQYLVDSDDKLSGQITVVQDIEELRGQLKNPESNTAKAINALLTGRQRAHGFLLGAAVHWYAAVALLPEPDTPTASRGKCCPQLFFCDSYNRPLVTLESEDELETLIEQRLDEWRERSCARLKEDLKWAHQPDDRIRHAVEEGVEEWWKGIRKSALFWRFQPAEIKRQLLRQELGGVKAYLDELASALRWQEAA
eukprot:TRINITY_DN76693_c0_g1_i1.p1 TRINITY_DN76693_c0_g1~~TRINITY_DN76693_c0_g1_i1.p1  ORF type:complete len:424 (-),score=89.81 TRINITY_DN76693_c0_g1_i1:210-1442(-)